MTPSSSRCRCLSTRWVTLPGRGLRVSPGSSREARLGPDSISLRVPSAASVRSSRTWASSTSMLCEIRRPASFSRGSAAIVRLYGTSSAVAASDRAW